MDNIDDSLKDVNVFAEGIIGNFVKELCMLLGALSAYGLVTEILYIPG